MLTRDEIQEIAKLGGPKVRARLKKMCPEVFDGAVPVEMNGTAKDTERDITLIEVRNNGKYTERAFWLCDRYAWTIKRDVGGCLVLIPRRKK